MNSGADIHRPISPLLSDGLLVHLPVELNRLCSQVLDDLMRTAHKLTRIDHITGLIYDVFPLANKSNSAATLPTKLRDAIGSDKLLIANLGEFDGDLKNAIELLGTIPCNAFILNSNGHSKQIIERYCRKVLGCLFDISLFTIFDLSSILSDKDDFMISFKGSHYPKDIILYAVFFYVRYAVSYRDLEEIMAERGVKIDHATLNRWVIKYSPMIASEAQRRKSQSNSSWRMDETYIKIRGKWVYYYRAVDKHGKTLDFMLSKQRNAKAARRFFKQAIDNHDVPEKVVIDKSGANLAGLLWTNVMLKFANGSKLIKILQVKYLNNIIEQDHRFIKKLTRPMMGFKSFRSASATLQGIEIAHMIRKHQFGKTNQSAFQQSLDNCAN